MMLALKGWTKNICMTNCDLEKNFWTKNENGEWGIRNNTHLYKRRNIRNMNKISRHRWLGYVKHREESTVLNRMNKGNIGGRRNRRKTRKHSWKAWRRIWESVCRRKIQDRNGNNETGVALTSAVRGHSWITSHVKGGRGGRRSVTLCDKGGS